MVSDNLIVNAIFNAIFAIINTFLNIIFAPINPLIDTLAGGLYTSELLTNFYNVINNYVLPTCGYFVHLIPPMTWDAILVFIIFYTGLYSIVLISHVIIKPLRVIKRLIPFV